jgi:hypothetical protein
MNFFLLVKFNVKDMGENTSGRNKNLVKLKSSSKGKNTLHKQDTLNNMSHVTKSH